MRHRPAGTGSGGLGTRSILGSENLLVHLAKRSGRLGAELVSEASPHPFVRGQRVRRPARRLEREHQLSREPLIERLLSDVRRQRGEQLSMLTPLQRELVVVQLHAQPLLCQGGAHVSQPRRVHARQRGAWPQPEGLGQARKCAVGVPSPARRPRIGDQATKPGQIEPLGVDDGDIPAAGAVDLQAGTANSLA